MRDKLLHPATWIATLALLVALGAPAQAAKLIDGKLLKNASVSGVKLKAGTVTEAKLAKAVRGKLAKAGTPGPRGIQGAQGAQGERGLPGPSLTCPTGTALHELACVETTARAAASWVTARAVCYAVGRRLPTLAELTTYRLRTDLGAPTVGSEWSGDFTGGTGTAFTNGVYQTMNAGVVDSGNAGTSSISYRCVGTPALG